MRDKLLIEHGPCKLYATESGYLLRDADDGFGFRWDFDFATAQDMVPQVFRPPHQVSAMLCLELLAFPRERWEQWADEVRKLDAEAFRVGRVQ